MASTRRLDAWIIVGLSLLSILVFGQVVFHDFVNFDDTTYVVRNANVIQGLNGQSIQWAFTTSHMSIWHPATWISHMLDCQFFGLHPAGHHITSLLLHLVSTIVLFILFRETTGALWRPAILAALFCVHPLRVESVAWIAQRKDVLSVCFGLLTLLFYSRFVARPSRARYMLTTALLVLALLSKPMMVTLPFLMLLMDVWPLGRIRAGLARGGGVESLGGLIREKSIWFMLSGVVSVVTYVVMTRAGTVVSADVLGLHVRISNALHAVLTYLGKTAWPTNLSVFYPYPPPPPLWWTVLLVMALGLVLGISLRSASRRPYVGMGWMWFLVGLVPVIGLVQQAQHLIADRYTYFPHIGLLAMGVWWTASILAKSPAGCRVAPGLAIGVVVALSLASMRQTRVWADSSSLFAHAVECNPENHVAHQNLASAYFAEERWQDATRHYARALEVEPFYHTKDTALISGYLAESAQRSARELRRRDENERALRYYSWAAEHGPRSAGLLYNTGNVLLALGRHEEAVLSFEAALDVDPQYPDAENNLGLALMNAGRLDDAEARFNEALARDVGNSSVLYNLACVAALRGDAVGCVALIQEAIRNGLAVDEEHMMVDEDLVAVRDSREFRAFLAQLSVP